MDTDVGMDQQLCLPSFLGLDPAALVEASAAQAITCPAAALVRGYGRQADAARFWKPLILTVKHIKWSDI
jgi:hypothetical protein